MEKTLLLNVFSTAKRHWRRYFVSVLLAAIANILLIINPLVLRSAITSLQQSYSWHSLTGWVFLMLCIAGGATFFQFKMRFGFISLSREVEEKMRLELFTKLQSQTPAFYDRHPIGGLMSRMTNDLENYRSVLGPGIIYPIYFITLVGPAMVAMAYISPSLTLIAAIPILLLPVGMTLLRSMTYETSMAVQRSLATMSTVVHEHYSGMRIVKGYGMEKGALARFFALCHHYLKVSIRLAFINGILFPILTLVTKLVTVFLVIAAGYVISHSWNVLSPADFASFMWIQSFVFLPVMMLGWAFPIYVHGSAAYARLVEIYDQPIEVQQSSNPLESISSKAPISFHGLTFSFPKAASPALLNIKLSLSPGEFVGITGPVGSGKTTLLRLLMREYEISHGLISIGDRDIHDYSHDALRDHFAYVEQHPFLFSTTLRENLLYGNPHATDEELYEALVAADLQKDIDTFPQGYDTVIGERGVNLSGGQKQRLALARAFLSQRPVLLLDDVFSSVDAETERHIFAKMRAMFSQHTIVLITHRVAILHQMDRVVTILQGQIAEEGTPQQLLARRGFYNTLYELQHLNHGEG
jgi:ATP-binding cassette subfamily B multidrug efflux pump